MLATGAERVSLEAGCTGTDPAECHLHGYPQGVIRESRGLSLIGDGGLSHLTWTVKEEHSGPDIWVASHHLKSPG